MIRRGVLVAACAIGLEFGGAGVASAGGPAVVVAPYAIAEEEARPISLNYGDFGYTDATTGEFVSLVGGHIESARLTVLFRPGVLEGEGKYDPASLRVSMVVPVTPDDPVNGSEYLIVTGDQLVDRGDGVYAYELVTDAHDGVVREGRFSLDIIALDPETFEPVPMAGAFLEGSGFFYDVAVPEPTSLAAIAGMVAMATRRRRR